MEEEAPPILASKPGESHVALLSTKLHIPRPRPHRVLRPHLVEQLRQGGEGGLALVSAPAGFGKTTLLAQWLAQSGTPAAWVSLGPEDNDSPSSLFYHFALGDLLREWNDLEAAERHLAQGIAQIDESLTLEPFVALLGYTALARLAMAQSNFSGALETLFLSDGTATFGLPDLGFGAIPAEEV